MTAKGKTQAGLGARHDRTLQEYQHDTYKLRGKLKEPTICNECGALFHKGRWTWGAKPADADEIICPACMRIRDKYPKGFVTLKGSFKDEQHEQVIGLVKNAEETEKKEHPLSRIMSIDTKPEGLVISTTDSHVGRRVRQDPVDHRVGDERGVARLLGSPMRNGISMIPVPRGGLVWRMCWFVVSTMMS